jgi:hypothetical protein
LRFPFFVAGDWPLYRFAFDTASSRFRAAEASMVNRAPTGPLWWNHHGIVVVRLALAWISETAASAPGTLTAAASILGGLVIAVGAYLANRPRPTVNAPPPPVPRFDPNSPIEMPTPPGPVAPIALLLGVGLLASAAAMVVMPLLETVLLLGAFEFRPREELIGDGFTAYGLVSGAVRFLASLFLGGLAVSAVESAYRRAATNQDEEAP